MSLDRPGTWNRFAYTHADLVNFYDPAGLCDLLPGTALCFDVTATAASGPYGGPPGGGTVPYWYHPKLMPLGLGPIRISYPEVTGGGDDPDAATPLSDAVMRGEWYDGPVKADQKLANPDCAGLFGLTRDFGNTSPDPLTVLSDISNSYEFGPIPPPDADHVTSATTTGVGSTSIPIGDGATMQVNTSVVIRVNNTSQSAAFVSGNVNDWATTILHELGHAHWDLYGQGTSKIAPDGGDTAASMTNTDLVKVNCKPWCCGFWASRNWTRRLRRRDENASRSDQT